MVNLSNPINSERDEMVRLFGGDLLAARAANALERDGIPSMKALNALLVTLGERGLRARLMDIRNLGVRALERIAQGLTEYREGDPPSQTVSQTLEAALPEGFARRVYCTTLHFRNSKEDPFPEVTDLGSPGGLTREDLFALSRLFSHEIFAED